MNAIFNETVFEGTLMMHEMWYIVEINSVQIGLSLWNRCDCALILCN